jgi:FkbM family methyltransferase
MKRGISSSRVGSLVAALGSARLDYVGSRIALARVVAPGPAFVARELAGVRRRAVYRLRETGLSLCVEHNTPDVLVIAEVFYKRLYEAPPEARVLPERPRVLDVGGNIGCFGVWLLGQRPDADVVAFEPDPRNLGLLRETVRANSFEDRWRIVEAAAGTRPGQVGFVSDEFATSHTVRSGDAPGSTITVDVVDLFDWTADTDLIKLDIEGGEWEIFADPRFADLETPLLVFEYHPEGCPDSDPHAAAREAMARAGFATSSVFEAPTGVGMMWAWRSTD